MPTPVTVIIATWNNAATLPAAVASLQAQTFADWVAIIVDDASTDDTPRVLAALCAAEPRLTSVRLECNVGAGGARNVGWRLAASEWIAVLDADDAWAPTKLEQQLAALAAVPDAQWSFTGVRDVRDGQVLLERRGVAGPEFVDRLVSSDCEVVHSSVIYRRAALDALGGFDPTLRRSQDWDLFHRLILRYGAQAVVPVSDLLLDYRRGEVCLSPTAISYGRRCQARIVARRLLRDGWLWRCPRRAYRMTDGYVDRLVEWATAWQDRRWAIRGSALAVVLAPWRRWRWLRLAEWLRKR